MPVQRTPRQVSITQEDQNKDQLLHIIASINV